MMFSASPGHIESMWRFRTLVTRPDGTASSFAASREFARVVGAPGNEVIALLVRDARVQDIPIGSIVSIEPGSVT